MFLLSEGSQYQGSVPDKIHGNPLGNFVSLGAKPEPEQAPLPSLFVKLDSFFISLSLTYLPTLVSIYWDLGQASQVFHTLTLWWRRSRSDWAFPLVAKESTLLRRYVRISPKGEEQIGIAFRKRDFYMCEIRVIIAVLSWRGSARVERMRGWGEREAYSSFGGEGTVVSDSDMSCFIEYVERIG